MHIYITGKNANIKSLHKISYHHKQTKEKPKLFILVNWVNRHSNSFGDGDGDVTLPVRVQSNQTFLSVLTQSRVALVVLHCPGRKITNGRQLKGQKVSSCHLADAAETCSLFRYLLGLGWCTTGGPGERAFFFRAFLAISLCFSVNNNNNNRGIVYYANDSNKNLISAWALHALQQTGSLSESEPAPNFCTLKAVVWLRFSCAPVYKVHSESSNHRWEAWSTTRNSKNTLLTHLRWDHSDHSLSWPVLCVTTLMIPPGPQWFRALVQCCLLQV